MNDSLPLVSILIPAFNQPVFLEKALISAINQSYACTEIIICDDSTNNHVEKLVHRYAKDNKNIKYFNNGGPLGQEGALNMQKCFDLSSGEYINYLMHDDLFHPNKIKVMVEYLSKNKDITLVTSYRKVVDKDDVYMYDSIPLTEQNCRINGEKLGLFILENMSNVIGEPTTAMFRKKDMDEKVLSYKGRMMRGFGDLAMWLKLLNRGNVLYVNEPLSYFRIHNEQNSENLQIHLWGIVDWFYLITNSYLNNDFIKSEEQYRIIMKKWFAINSPMIKSALQYLNDHKKELKDLIKDIHHCYIQASKIL
jgi:glycosyltransferase involved in cell wall biosynthesis